MVDKLKFMETLRSVAEIARVSTTPMSKEEIQSYFKDMDLSEEQQEMVYQYLLTNPSTQEEQLEEQAQKEAEQQEKEKEEAAAPVNPIPEHKDSVFVQMYLDDIGDGKQLSKEESEELYQRLLKGDDAVIQPITDAWLTQVVTIAKTYQDENVITEDVIQEGNLGLLNGVSELLGSNQQLDVEEYLTNAVKKAMVEYINGENDEGDWENTILAKVTLVYEAKKALAEQLGRTPDLQELCDYTKLPSDEIADIERLAKEKKKQLQNPLK